MTLDEQIEVIKAQIFSPEANFTLVEKLMYLNNFFKPDPTFTQEALDAVFTEIMERETNGG